VKTPGELVRATSASAKTEVAKGAKLIIRRTSETTAVVEAAPAAAVEAPAPVVVAEEPMPLPAPVQSAPEIVFNEPVVQSEPEARPAAPPPPQADATPKRRIVIIRHKPGEQIDVPLQSEFAQAS
jgi:hypothetical protein